MNDKANELKLKNIIVPPSLSSWSTFHDAQLEVNTRKQNLINEIDNDKSYSNESMEIMIDLYTDYAGRNERGLSELQEYFDLIEFQKKKRKTEIKSIDEQLTEQNEKFSRFFVTVKPAFLTLSGTSFPDTIPT